MSSDSEDSEEIISVKDDIDKRPFKEKVVGIYELFIKKEDPSQGNPNFWNEFFLLRANVDFLEAKFDSMSVHKIAYLTDTWNYIFNHCILILKKDDSQIRAINSIQTMCALVRGVYKKISGEYDAIEILIGFNKAERQMKLLIEQLSRILCLDRPSSLKALVLKFLLILVTATENVSQNTLLEYFMINSVFEPVIQLLKDSKSRQLYGYDAVLLLTILVNYRKHESANPYIVKLSIIDSEMSLNGFGQVVSLVLSEFNRKFCELHELSQSSDIVSSLTSLMSRMFTAQLPVIKMDIRPNNAVLLALYEAIHLNRNFLICLTHCQTDASAPFRSAVAGNIDFTLPDATSDTVDSDLLPSNLLATFLEFSSIVMQNTKEEDSMNTCKLCFIILTCIAEDQYANSIMHDVNLIYKVQLHRMPMRHRKIVPDRNSCRPLASPLLDLMVEFILSHLTKVFPSELYSLCLGVIHRILCYQKRSRVRLQYNWKELWTALISLVNFWVCHEALLMKTCNIFNLCVQVVNILNLFITFGDTFLPSPTSYDELYYEIVRMNLIFDSLYSLTLRYSSSENEFKESAARLLNSLVNIRAIVNHFTPKIDTWLSDHAEASLTQDQVLEVVRTNYDTLTLKLYDNLDQFEKYSEKPNETALFTLLVRSVVSEYRESLSFKSLEMQAILKEFSTIT